jgi:hypothetical protein
MTQVRTDYGDINESARRTRAEKSGTILTGTNVQQDLGLLSTAILTGAPRQQRSVTASPITVVPSDSILNVNISTGSPICTLPPASSRNGSPLTYKDVGGQFAAHNLTLTPFAGDTIDGAASLVLNANRQSITLTPFNDGVNTGWFIT